MNLRVSILLALLLVVVTALSLVWARHESRVLFVELQSLESERDEMNMDWGRLQLEQSAWATKARIERIAREELDMQRPVDVEMVLVEP
ncbi:cell division protein FtsL [Natronospira proteinivora]|uniref:Cell division protein FtsL n=1 Tax=Natronospira proteinivora TaxID=1807133 RepID=A0ABT1G481_9GAMM|nr:cell division protein FtsL [Natronospira proteinivora]MCP1726099.1 cell division protein FtsL [Natronospira proteinivora]